MARPAPGTPGRSRYLIGDFNKDGNPDIAVTVSGDYPRLLLGNGVGEFRLAGDQDATYGPGPAGTGAAAADFNGDGSADLVALSYAGLDGFGTPVVYFGNGDAGLSAPLEEDSGSVAVADFNGDHRSDMVSIGPAGLVVELGGSGGGFAETVTPAGGKLWR